MEQKNMPFDCKVDTEKRTFEGYASTYDKDLVGDIIQEGAFRKTISERFPKNQIKVLWQHSEPLGMPTYMEEDSKGLYVKGRISKTSLGNDALELMADGVVDTMSIGYDVVKDDLSTDGGARFLKELKLYEFSPVTFPANPAAGITSVRKNLTEQIKEFKAAELEMLVKEGRTLSKANIKAIQEAITSLEKVLELAGTDRADGKSHSGQVGEPSDFTHLFEEMKNYARDLKQK